MLHSVSVPDRPKAKPFASNSSTSNRPSAVFYYTGGSGGIKKPSLRGVGSKIGTETTSQGSASSAILGDRLVAVG